MPKIDFNQQEVNIIIEAFDLAIKQIGIKAARPYTFLMDKIDRAFELENKVRVVPKSAVEEKKEKEARAEETQKVPPQETAAKEEVK